MDHLALERHTANRRAAVQLDRVARPVILEFLRKAERGAHPIQAITQLLEHGFVGLANPRRRLDQRFKYPIEVRASSG